MKDIIHKTVESTQHWLHVIFAFFVSFWDRVTVIILFLCICTGSIWYLARYTESPEMSLRQHIVRVAESYLGYREDDGSHRQIVDTYNSHEPRARGYEVTYEDSWCAVFASTVALEADMLGWIPMECSCEQQILLFQQQDNWVEADHFMPKPGDYIYYDWNSKTSGDCTGWSDHVGIVVQTFGPAIKVIEGNKDDDVSYRYIFINDPSIRGFGIPDYHHYASLEKKNCP